MFRRLRELGREIVHPASPQFDPGEDVLIARTSARPLAQAELMERGAEVSNLENHASKHEVGVRAGEARHRRLAIPCAKQGQGGEARLLGRLELPRPREKSRLLREDGGFEVASPRLPGDLDRAGARDVVPLEELELPVVADLGEGPAFKDGIPRGGRARGDAFVFRDPLAVSERPVALPDLVFRGGRRGKSEKKGRD
jgi:hypothetical protein